MEKLHETNIRVGKSTINDIIEIERNWKRKGKEIGENWIEEVTKMREKPEPAKLKNFVHHLQSQEPSQSS